MNAVYYNLWTNRLVDNSLNFRLALEVYDYYKKILKFIAGLNFDFEKHFKPSDLSYAPARCLWMSLCLWYGSRVRAWNKQHTHVKCFL